MREWNWRLRATLATGHLRPGVCRQRSPKRPLCELVRAAPLRASSPFSPPPPSPWPCPRRHLPLHSPGDHSDRPGCPALCDNPRSTHPLSGSSLTAQYCSAHPPSIPQSGLGPVSSSFSASAASFTIPPSLETLVLRTSGFSFDDALGPPLHDMSSPSRAPDVRDPCLLISSASCSLAASLTDLCYHIKGCSPWQL